MLTFDPALFLPNFSAMESFIVIVICGSVRKDEKQENFKILIVYISGMAEAILLKFGVWPALPPLGNSTVKFVF